jgi:hypothetical protein
MLSFRTSKKRCWAAAPEEDPEEIFDPAEFEAAQFEADQQDAEAVELLHREKQRQSQQVIQNDPVTCNVPSRAVRVHA